MFRVSHIYGETMICGGDKLKQLETHSLALWNCSSRPIMYNVSRESTRVAPRPPKLSTPSLVCGCLE